jgi:choline dehydrogenase-like flavoprotein
MVSSDAAICRRSVVRNAGALAATVGAARIARAAGATEAWAAPISQQHILGGTAIGSDPARSVTNGFGQAHDHENLFLAGSRLFATSGAVNPTFTLSALALRSAEHTVRNWSSLA